MAEVKLNFLLVGKTGQGKSATGNSLLNKKYFKTSTSTLPETQEVDFSVAPFGNYALLVVDEPGFDISMNKVKDKITAATHVEQALAMCPGGIDAFLFVLKFGNRFTADDRYALDVLKRMFGPSFLNHIIVVITGGDIYKSQPQEEGGNISFHDWCKQQMGEFRQLYEECKGRFVLVNNREVDEEKKKTQIQEIVRLAQGLREKQDRYTSQCFQDAERERQKLIEELKTAELAQGIQQTSLKTTQKKEIKLNFLLMGKTGQGKSATGNSLLNRKYFKAAAKSTSVTQVVDFSFADFENYILLVVDGPGLADTVINKTEDKQESDVAEDSMNKAKEMLRATENMNVAITMCYGGVDVFLLVTKFGNRFTGEDLFTLQALKKIFGPSYMDHVIVVVTCGDSFEGAMKEEESEINFHKWCKQQKGEFKQLYDDCQERFVLFNNRETDEEKKQAQIQEIVQLAHGLQKKHKSRYTSQCFTDAEREREKMVVELKAPHLAREIQEKVSLLTGDIEKISQSYSESEKEKIKARTDDLIREIDVQDKGTGVLDDMRKQVEGVKEHIDDVVELQKLAKQLKATTTGKIVTTVMTTLYTVGGVAAFVAGGPITWAVAAGAAAITSAGAAVTGLSYAIHKFVENKIEQKQTEITSKRKQ